MSEDPSHRAIVIRPPDALTPNATRPGGVLARMTREALNLAERRDVTEARFPLGGYHFREPDYRQILLWADAIGMSPEAVLECLEAGELGDEDPDRYAFTVTDGALTELVWDFDRLPIAELNWAPGLRLQRLAFRGEHTLQAGRLAPILPSLDTLFCYGNGLTSLDLWGVPSLTRLYCAANRLTTLDLSAVPDLTVLECVGNPLTVLDLSAVPGLTEHLNEEIYQAAKPHFEAALRSFQEAGHTLKKLFKFLIENFGLGIKPYAIRFVQEKRIDRELESFATSTEKDYAVSARTEVES